MKNSKGAPGRALRLFRDMVQHTPVLQLAFLLVVLWMLFAAALYWAERGADGTTIDSYGRALYWGIAAFSTAGIANMPVNGISEVIGAVWIVLGSMLFFGAIVATVTTYFMRPMQRPSKRIIETIEYNLEQLDDLSVDDLELLRHTTDSLIKHVENLKNRQLQLAKKQADGETD
ncbi:MAG: ion transporter [Gammaproteobacteria bacterium]|nr:ion transporter [Gammaproteobacteria bacterium]